MRCALYGGTLDACYIARNVYRTLRAILPYKIVNRSSLLSTMPLIAALSVRWHYFLSENREFRIQTAYRIYYYRSSRAFAICIASLISHFIAFSCVCADANVFYVRVVHKLHCYSFHFFASLSSISIILFGTRIRSQI